MNYFSIEPITINLTPFETSSADAIRWEISNIERGATSAVVSCFLIDSRSVDRSFYTWNLIIPQDTLSQWSPNQTDYVIDNFIVNSSNGVFVIR
jgi:hypothetical protein